MYVNALFILPLYPHYSVLHADLLLLLAGPHTSYRWRHCLDGFKLECFWTERSLCFTTR